MQPAEVAAGSDCHNYCNFILSFLALPAPSPSWWCVSDSDNEYSSSQSAEWLLNGIGIIHAHKHKWSSFAAPMMTTNNEEEDSSDLILSIVRWRVNNWWITRQQRRRYWRMTTNWTFLLSLLIIRPSIQQQRPVDSLVLLVAIALSISRAYPRCD